MAIRAQRAASAAALAASRDARALHESQSRNGDLSDRLRIAPRLPPGDGRRAVQRE
ncbi:MAG TPA: hypothetical protein VGR63_12555 [Casimicrobiaceae bacterium]|jgi:hypothetical protein|nr:hypothetical protein [Casimicrobiaceae bacterium]